MWVYRLTLEDTLLASLGQWPAVKLVAVVSKSKLDVAKAVQAYRAQSKDAAPFQSGSEDEEDLYIV